MKKVFAIVLCLAMCLSVLALTASADEAYYVAGSVGLCGVAWDPGAEANKMTPNADGTWSITYTNVPAGLHEFKVTDGTWNNCWPGSNYQLQLDVAGDVTIIFNPTTYEVSVSSAAQGVVTAPEIDYMEILGENVEGISWNVGESARMTLVSEGVYEYTFENVAAGTWPNIKFAANGNWSDYNFGCIDGNVGATSGAAHEAGWNSSNIWFEVKEASKVTIRLDLTAFDYESKSGATYTVTIAPLSGSGSDTTLQPDNSNSKTGDPIAVIFALLAVSAAGIAVVAKKKF